MILLFESPPQAKQFACLGTPYKNPPFGGVFVWGRKSREPIPQTNLRNQNILNSDLERNNNDIFSILLDDGYMQILKEKLKLIAEKRKELNLV